MVNDGENVPPVTLKGQYTAVEGPFSRCGVKLPVNVPPEIAGQIWLAFVIGDGNEPRPFEVPTEIAPE